MKGLRRLYGLGLLTVILTVAACSDSDDTVPTVEAPATYTFERNGQSTVSFSGQTTRIQMATELVSAMKDIDNSTEALLLEMFRNETANGGDANPFSNADLNASTKSVRSKTGASKDYFFTNATEAAQIKADFEGWISAQVSEVFPAENQIATPGNPGQLADGSSTRYVNGKGLEYDQAVNKGLIGALMLDQMLNNYLSVSVLDEADNRANNDNEVLVEGKMYTTMEHKWDEAYGYLFGTAANAADPVATIGSSDAFLNKYLGRVEGDPDFAGIAQEVYDALKLGRAAIVAGEYEVRDAQAAIVRQKLSEVIAIRAIYYLQQGKNALAQDPPAYGTAFHDLSEGFGFLYSLRFTRQPQGDMPYFTKAEVDGFIQAVYGSTNGFWDVDATTLDNVSGQIAAKFDFTVAQAGN